MTIAQSITSASSARVVFICEMWLFKVNLQIQGMYMETESKYVHTFI